MKWRKMFSKFTKLRNFTQPGGKGSRKLGKCQKLYVVRVCLSDNKERWYEEHTQKEQGTQQQQLNKSYDKSESFEC